MEGKNKELNLSVIIPTLNCKHYLKLCLESLYNNASKPHEVVVCVDGSKDGTWEMLDELSQKYDSLNVIGFEDNIGECTAFNRAVEHATSEYILLVNDDMVFMPDWDKYLTEAYNQCSADVMACRLIEPGLVKVANIFVEKDCGTSYDKFDAELFKKTVSESLPKEYVFDKGGHNQPMLLRKSDFMKVGGWDERFNTGPLSDPDFYMKLLLSGTTFARTHNVLFYHFSGKATRFEGESKTETKSYQHKEEINANLFKEKWGFLPMGDPNKAFGILTPNNAKGITFDWTTPGLYEEVLRRLTSDVKKELGQEKKQDEQKTD